MTETEAINYIEKLQGSGIVPGLSRIQGLLDRMGNPEKDLRFIHIAGTNGKGSTLAFVSTILSKQGYRVGRYISPSITCYRERFQVSGRNISADMLAKGMTAIKECIDAMEAEGADTPSAFEAETALAFWFFKEKKCDFVVLEVGMGGLEDATNVIPAPEVAALASISYDHMQFLGKTLKEIATQKAGIIKPGCSVVSQIQHDEAAEVIRKIAGENGCELSFVSQEDIVPGKVKAFKPGVTKQKDIRQLFSYKGYKKLQLSLSGRYQLKNAALAIEVIEALRRRGVKVSDEAVAGGLANTVWPGRFQMISEKPCIFLDGAHNEEAAQRLAETIDFYFTNTRIIYIMGMLKDKEYEKVASLTAPKAEAIFTVTPPGNARALSAYDLAVTVKEYNSAVTATDSLEEALEMAGLMAGKDGVIIVFGSLSFLGRMMELISDDGSGKNKNSNKITP